MNYEELANKTKQEFPEEQEIIELLQHKNRVNITIKLLYELCCLVSYDDFINISPGNLKNEQAKLERRNKLYQEWLEYKSIFLDKLPG